MDEATKWATMLVVDDNEATASVADGDASAVQSMDCTSMVYRDDHARHGHGRGHYCFLRGLLEKVVVLGRGDQWRRSAHRSAVECVRHQRREAHCCRWPKEQWRQNSLHRSFSGLPQEQARTVSEGRMETALGTEGTNAGVSTVR